jgi:hypothetical protein
LKTNAATSQLFPEQTLEILCDFGPQPVSNRFPEKPLEDEFSMNMELGICPRSGLVQLTRTFPPEELRPRVPWLAGFEPEGHLDALADELASLPGLSREDWVAGYSLKDDTLLRRFGERGFEHRWRLDPAKDLGLADPCAFVETIQIPFVNGTASNAFSRAGRPKLFVVRHVLEHSYDLLGFLRAARNLITPDGYVVFEVPDCARAMENLDFTTLWEEHSVYFTSATFQSALKQAGFEIFRLEIIPHPFENCMVAICRIGEVGDAELAEPLLQEELVRARRFGSEFPRVTDRLHAVLAESQQNGTRMALFGAGHLAVAFTSLHRTGGFFEFIVDDNPHKSGRHLAGCGLPILPSGALEEKKIDLCLLALNPEHEEKVIEKNRSFVGGGGRFASIFPSSPRYLFA